MAAAPRSPLLVWVLCLSWMLPGTGLAGDGPADWLEVPSGWTRQEAEGNLAFTPGDLPAGRSYLFLVAPPGEAGEDLDAAYRDAITQFGPWTPVGAPVDQAFEGGWRFRFGVGVVQLEGNRYTALTAVAVQGKRGAGFWVLADSDDTYNRYATQAMTAISSVQDSDRAPPPASSGKGAPAPAPAPGGGGRPAPPGLRPVAFGEGTAGVYLGLERGLRASAGAGDQELVLDLVSGHLSAGSAPGSPQVRTSLQDTLEIDVLLPDGRYRRGLPKRGLATDLAWDQRIFKVSWGTWKQTGDTVELVRGSYRTQSRVQGDALVSHRDRPWRKLTRQGARLAGSFTRIEVRGPEAPRLLLAADGSYQDRGGFLRMVGSMWNMVVPDGDRGMEGWPQARVDQAMGPGSGSYTLDGFTMSFHDRDGRRWSFGAYLPPGQEAGKERFLVLGGYTLAKE